MIDLKLRLNEPALLELVSLSIGNPTPERLEQICQRYRQHSRWKIMGYESDGRVIGCIGIEISEPTQGVVRCISVLPSERNKGIGRSMLNEIVELTGLTSLIAETDREAVDFYQKCGFQVESLGEIYPHVERFRCFKSF